MAAVLLLFVFGETYVMPLSSMEPTLEPYVAFRDSAPRRAWPRVPEGAVFLVGDNRSQSCDSRAFCPVPKGNVVGRVWAVYWPPSRIGFR